MTAPAIDTLAGMISDHKAERLQVFLHTLAETCQVKVAAAAAGYDASTLYKMRKADPEFAAQWDEAVKAGLPYMISEAHRRAHGGIDEPLVFQGQFTYARDYQAIDPETGEPYPPHLAPLKRDADGNPVVVTRKVYSDTLLMFLIRAHDPSYRERSTLDVNARGAFANVDVKDRERAKRLTDLLLRVGERRENDAADLL